MERHTFPQANQPRLYGDLAWTWPIISCKENYIEEAQQFCQLIRQYSRIEAQTLLHLGCGGGHLDWTLKQHFRITAVDLSEAMLGLARRLNPEVTYLQGDMRTVRLGQLFDAVMVADSITYMTTPQDLRAAFAAAFVHLKPGGVFCTYAEATRESFQQNKTECSSHSAPGVDIAFYESYYDPDPADTTYESVFVFLIRRGGKLTIETDRHLGGLFPLQTWQTALEEVGFEATLLTPEGQPPLFVGVRPAVDHRRRPR